MLAIYTRLSVEDPKRNSSSIKNQKREGKAFAKKHNLEYKIYDEGEGVSGAKPLDKRPILAQLMNDVDNGKIKALWARDRSRLARDSHLQALLNKSLEDASVDVYYEGKLYDHSDPTEKLIGIIKTGVNEFQRLNIKRQVKQTLRDSVIEGKAHGILPYGYMRDENKLLVVHDQEAEWVRKIFELSLKGNGTDKIAQFLNDSNVPTRLNGHPGSLTLPNKRIVPKQSLKWAGNTVRNIIRNTIYKGKRNWSGEVFDCPAIVDAEYWQKVNDNFKSNSNTRGRKVNHRYLLKGIIKCGRCGRNYYGRSRVDKSDHYYMCSSKRRGYENCGNRSINIGFIEELIWRHFFTDGVYLAYLKAHYQRVKETDQVKAIEAKIESLKADTKQLDRELENLIEAVRKGGLEEDDIRSSRTSIKSRKNSINSETTALEEQLKLLAPAIQQDHETELEALKSQEVSFKDRRELVGKYIHGVAINTIDTNEAQFYDISLVFKATREPIIYIAPFNKKWAIPFRCLSNNTLGLVHPENNLEQGAGEKNDLLKIFIYDKSTPGNSTLEARSIEELDEMIDFEKDMGMKR